MAHAATLAAELLAALSISDEHFYEATALLATRFDRRSELGDLRADDEAPGVLFAWFEHAVSRVPDMRVWDMTCRVNDYFDPDYGFYLPHDWPWNTRERLLSLSARLRSLPEWRPAFEQALMAPDGHSIRAVACCGGEVVGVEPFAAVWAYLSEHVEDGFIWYLIDPYIDDRRLPGLLALARMALLRDEMCMPSAQRKESLWYVWRQVLTLLQRFPGEGLDLVEAALRSRDTGLRLHTIDLLSLYWHDVELPLDTRNLIAECAAEETEQVARRRFDELLQRV